MDPAPYSAPLWPALPEDQQVRATFASSRARTTAGVDNVSKLILSWDHKRARMHQLRTATALRPLAPCL